MPRPSRSGGYLRRRAHRGRAAARAPRFSGLELNQQAVEHLAGKVGLLPSLLWFAAETDRRSCLAHECIEHVHPHPKFGRRLASALVIDRRQRSASWFIVCVLVAPEWRLLMRQPVVAVLPRCCSPVRSNVRRPRKTTYPSIDRLLAIFRERRSTTAGSHRSQGGRRRRIARLGQGCRGLLPG